MRSCVLDIPSYQASSYEFMFKSQSSLECVLGVRPVREMTVYLNTTMASLREVSIAAALTSGISEQESTSSLKEKRHIFMEKKMYSSLD